MTQPRAILVLIPSSSHYGREVLRGIADFTRRQARWCFARDPWSIADDADVRFDGHCDGVLALSGRAQYPAMHTLRNVPWVALADVYATRGPCVGPDNNAVGHLAAAHLRSCGLQHFGFCGYAGFLFSRQRGAAFAQALGPTAGPVAECSSQADGTDRAEARERQRLQHWLRALPLPIGIFAANDARAAAVTSCCREIGLRVPQDVAVIGVDNDDLVCEFSTPPLSSIALDARRVGRAGAALLWHLLARPAAAPPPRPILVKPLGLIQRQSSDTFAAEDPLLAHAFLYLRQHACEGLTVRRLVHAVPVARRTLEKASQRLLGHSLLAEIRLVQLNRVKELLAESDLSIDAVARAAGLPSGKYLADIFRKTFGTTPRAYRRTQRLPRTR